MIDETTIRNLCQQRGLTVSQVRLANDVLVVTPTSIDALPDADTLADLSEKLREVSSARYVTLGINDETTPGEATDR
jgi:hypothetical protein